MENPKFRAKYGVLLWAFVAATLATGCKSVGGKPAGGAGCTDPMMIDDMEDGDRFICGGRSGYWYTLGDGTSKALRPSGDFTPTEITGGRGTSRYAAHMSGFGFVGWGAAMGVHLNAHEAEVQPYDASTTQGVTFWMKSDVPVSVSFPLPETLAPDKPGGTCVDGPMDWNCDNMFRFLVTEPKHDEWVEYDVPFTALAQIASREDYGKDPSVRSSATFDLARLLGVRFDVGSFPT